MEKTTNNWTPRIVWTIFIFCTLIKGYAQTCYRIAICNNSTVGIKVPNLYIRHKNVNGVILIDNQYSMQNDTLQLTYLSKIIDDRISIDGQYNDIKLKPYECVCFDIRLPSLINAFDSIRIFYDSKKLSVYVVQPISERILIKGKTIRKRKKVGSSLSK